MTSTNPLSLTELTRGGGCGCKVDPAALAKILQNVVIEPRDPNLLVGLAERDDAAVYRLSQASVVVSTADFFTPIVDDPFDFGAVAAANALSDVYAMGAKPFLAIALLGWPLSHLDESIAKKVLLGAQDVCTKAGVSLGGGHSINSPEPIFGLAVTGAVTSERVVTMQGARPGAEIYLSKPLGVGILADLHKRHVLAEADYEALRHWMMTLNSVGERLGEIPAVQAMTDVTGYGFLGHLIEVCDASGVSAKVEYDAIPVMAPLVPLLKSCRLSGGTLRNFASYADRISHITPEQQLLLCDPQTSGGLLVAVDPDGRAEFLQVAEMAGVVMHHVGRFDHPSPVAVVIE